MIIVLKQHAPHDKVQAFTCNELNSMGFRSTIPSAATPTFSA